MTEVTLAKLDEWEANLARAEKILDDADRRAEEWLKPGDHSELIEGLEEGSRLYRSIYEEAVPALVEFARDVLKRRQMAADGSI